MLRELLQAGRYDEAKLYLAEAPEEAPALEALLNLRACLRSRDYQGAQKILQSTPQLASYLDLQEAQRALAAFSQEEDLEAFLENPHLGAEAYCLKGVALARQGALKEAQSAFQRALELDPGHYRAKTNLANLALQEGHLEEAVQLYQEVLAEHPDYPNAHHNLAVAYRRQGKIEESVHHLKQSQRLSLKTPRSALPRAPSAWSRRWWIALLLLLALYWLVHR